MQQDAHYPNPELNNNAKDSVSWWLVLLIFLAIFATYAIFADSSTLWDRDEPRFARAAVEMYQTGDFIVPYFNGETRLHKPAGIYWLMDLGLALFGFSELAVRLPSVVGISLTSLFTFFIGRRLFNPKVGLFAMIIFPTMLVPLFIGSITAATADGSLVASITLAIWMIIEIIYRPRWYHYIVLTLALGAAWLIKGPVGFAIPALTALGCTFFGRGGAVKIKKRTWFALIIASIFALGLFIAWGIPANIQTDGQFYAEGIGKHVIGRSTTAMESHGGSGILGYILTLPVYFLVVLIGVGAWVVFLPFTVSGLLKGYIGSDRARAILWGWMVPTFLMMSLVATKLPHYILPIFPAIAIAFAAAVHCRMSGHSPEKDDGWFRTGLAVFVTFISTSIIFGFVAPWILGSGSVNITYIFSVLLALLTFVVMIVIDQLVKRYKLYFASVLIALMFPCLAVPTMILLMPQVDEAFKPSKTIAQGIHQIVQEDVPVLMAGYEEPSLVFYINRPAGEVVEETGGDPTEIYTWARESGPGVLIITRKNFDKVQEKFGPMSLTKLFDDETINYSAKARLLDILVLGRNMSSDMVRRATIYQEQHHELLEIE